MDKQTDTAKIRALNDAFRQSFVGGHVMLTQGVQTLSPSRQTTLMEEVKHFASFTDANDPHGEHDFGSIDLEGTKFFWKIDAYDQKLEFCSDDPADPTKTTRVLTVMRADEY